MVSIINKTRYPTSELAEAIRYAQPNPKIAANTQITFVYGTGNTVGGSILGKVMNGKVVIEIGLPRKSESKEAYPTLLGGVPSQGYISRNVLTFKEDLIHVLAHEFRHAEQMYRAQTGGRHAAVESSRGYRSVSTETSRDSPERRAMERDADIHAAYKWGAYRSMSRPAGYAENFFGKWFSGNKKKKRR